MSNYIIKNLLKQKEVVEGSPIDLDGEVIMIGALDEEEKAQMIAEGYELGNQVVTIDGKKTKLIDIEKGSVLFTVMEVKEFEDANYTGLWYIWRSRAIMKAFKKLSEKAQEQLKTILANKGLDIYLEEL